jgi:hypothetical protein
MLRVGGLDVKKALQRWNLASNKFTLGPRRNPTENAKLIPPTNHGTSPLA